MLKLNKKVDYGVIIVTHLVMSGDRVVSAADVARAYQLSRPLVANVLKLLSHAELVGSQRGSKGGYRLLRPAAEITLTDVVHAIDGQFQLTECTHTGGDGTGNTTCDLAGTCPIRRPVQFVHDEVSQVLDRLSFDQIARGAPSMRQAATRDPAAAFETPPPADRDRPAVRRASRQKTAALAARTD